jgi:AraC-like DNA-binding protein
LVGTVALSSFFFYSSAWVTATAGIYALFYVGFGLFYIQYPNTFTEIEQAITETEVIVPDETEKVNRLPTWDKLKQQVIQEKYYLNSGVTIEEIAQLLKIGRTSLSGFINKEERVNFNLWINTLRIEEAKKHLVNHPDFSIAKVSELVGFSEQSNFSRQFKLLTQQSPSEWRQQNLA